MKYTVQIAEDTQVELDIAPGVPDLSGVTLEWWADTAEEASEMFAELGGPAEWSFAERSAFRFAPVTRDGEALTSALLRVWLPNADVVAELRKLRASLAQAC